MLTINATITRIDQERGSVPVATLHTDQQNYDLLASHAVDGFDGLKVMPKDLTIEGEFYGARMRLLHCRILQCEPKTDGGWTMLVSYLREDGTIVLDKPVEPVETSEFDRLITEAANRIHSNVVSIESATGVPMKLRLEGEGTLLRAVLRPARKVTPGEAELLGLITEKTGVQFEGVEVE